MKGTTMAAALKQEPIQIDRSKTMVAITTTSTIFLNASEAPVPGISTGDLSEFLTQSMGQTISVERIHSYTINRHRAGKDVIVPHYDPTTYDENGQIAGDRRIDISPATNGEGFKLTLLEGDVERVFGTYETIQMAGTIGEAWMARRIDL
jgi:hypothetical protein